MARMGRYRVLFLVMLLSVALLFIIKPVSAQPAVPSFTIKYQDNSYQKNSTTFIQNQTIQIIIKHQPIGDSESVLYIIEEKNHSSNNWNSTGVSHSADTQSQFTLIVYALKGNNASSTFNGYLDYSVGDIVDFKMYAVLYQYLGPSDEHIQSGYWQEVSRSQWSNTQTLTIGGSCSTITPAPTVPEFPIITALVVVLATVSLLIVIGNRKLAITNH